MVWGSDTVACIICIHRLGTLHSSTYVVMQLQRCWYELAKTDYVLQAHYEYMDSCKYLAMRCSLQGIWYELGKDNPCHAASSKAQRQRQ